MMRAIECDLVRERMDLQGTRLRMCKTLNYQSDFVYQYAEIRPLCVSPLMSLRVR